MKNTERVATILAELRELTENDFERYQIDVLKRDLTSPPTVEIVDDTHQRFNGKIYSVKQDGHYGTLHRDVWEYYYGAIPNGYVIHHINFDKADNDITNLQMVTKKKHGEIHNPERHKAGSPKQKEFICDVCGKEYISFDVGQHTHYCSKRCLEKAKRMRLIKTIICQNCGEEFVVRKHDNRTRFCSKKCAQIFNHAKAVETKKCPVCGKEFECYRYRKQECCSLECGNKWRSIKRLVSCKCEACGKEFKRTLDV